MRGSLRKMNTATHALPGLLGKLPQRESPFFNVLYIPSEVSVRPELRPESQEMRRVRERTQGFCWKGSTVWRQLTDRYGPRLCLDELKSIAAIVAERVPIRLDRDARRRKTVIVKWFQENWMLIEPLLPSIILEPA
jgi:hypothetical protein